MPFVLLEISTEAAIEELRQNPSVRVLWVEPPPMPIAHSSAQAGQNQKLPPLLIEPANEQALELLRQLEKLSIIRILPYTAA